MENQTLSLVTLDPIKMRSKHYVKDEIWHLGPVYNYTLHLEWTSNLNFKKAVEKGKSVQFRCFTKFGIKIL